LPTPFDSPQISVIILHLNQPESLDDCLASLGQQTLDESLFEIIVVDNGSAHNPENVVARHPPTRLLHESIPGPGPARNAGVLDARGRVIAFIDADCRAHPDWLNVALDRIDAAPQSTVLGGDVRIWHQREKNYTAVEAYESVFAYQFKRYIEQKAFSGTGNLVMRREDFDKVGLFGGIQIAEDIDWGHRASAAGLTFKFVPQMIVFHPPRRSIGELLTKWDRHLQHNLNMARGNTAWRLRWVVRAFVVLVSPLIDVFTVFRSDRIEGAAERFKASMVLILVRAYRAWIMMRLLLLPKGILWNRDSELRSPNAK